MRRAALALALTLAVASCAGTHYEYKTLDRTNEPRLSTADGRNAVMREMTAAGWELEDPKMALPFHDQVWRREQKR